MTVVQENSYLQDGALLSLNRGGIEGRVQKHLGQHIYSLQPRF
jgi:hypothetical protein